MNSARERILNKLPNNNSNSRVNQTENSKIYTKINNNLLELFKNELEKVNGDVFIANSVSDLEKRLNTYIVENKLDNIYSNHAEIKLPDNLNHIKSFSNDIELAITGCEFLSARTGSVVVSSNDDGRKINIFAPIHIIIANENQIVYDIDEVIESLQNKYEKLPSTISFVTGPSRTADIEKTLILGAHGPKRLVVFILKN